MIRITTDPSSPTSAIVVKSIIYIYMQTKKRRSKKKNFVLINLSFQEKVLNETQTAVNCNAVEPERRNEARDTLAIIR